MTDEHFTVPQSLVKHWDVVLDDVADAAAGYREDGWDAHELHPGHVSVLPDSADRTGFEVLVPDNEFDPVTGLDATVDEFRVLGEERDGLGYRVVIAEDRAAETVVLVPLYYEFPAVDQLRASTAEDGVVGVHVRALSKDKGVLTFELDDPDLLFPDG